MNSKRWAGIIGTVVLMVPAWAFLAPAPLGGTTYSVVAGSSMEPHLKDGALVVSRVSRYEVGDVVAYRSDTAGSRLLMHRIVDASGARFTLKGDANDWLDADRPTEAEIVGKLWFSVPAIGSLLAGPWPLMLAISLLASALIGAGRRIRRRRTKDDGASSSTATHDEPIRADRVTVAVTMGSVAALLLIGAWTFVTPANASRQLDYSHTGTFSYGASVPESAAYPDGELTTGEPVFLRLVDGLDVRFEHGLRSSALADIGGAITLSATIRDEASRWQHTIELGSPVRIGSPDSTATARLDVRALRAFIERFEASTGLKPAHYGLSLDATVGIVGSLDGAALSTRFTASFPMILNEGTLQPSVTPQGSGPTAGTASNASGSLRVPGPRSLTPVFGLARTPLRAGVGAGVIAFLIMGLPSAMRLLRTRVRPPRRVERLVVEAHTEPAAPWRTSAVTVASMEDLAWIAERGNRPILHEFRGTFETFEVRDGDVVYRFHPVTEESARQMGANDTAATDSRETA